jgi:hypothetical protein
MTTVLTSDVFAAVKVQWDASAPVVAAFPGGLHKDRAGVDVAFRYAIFQLISSVRTKTTSTVEIWETVWKFCSYSNISAENASAGARIIAAAFNSATLTIAGATMNKLRLIDEDALDDPADYKVKRYDLKYEMAWQKPRSDL